MRLGKITHFLAPIAVTQAFAAARHARDLPTPLMQIRTPTLLCQNPRLKQCDAKIQPARRAVDSLAHMRRETKREQDDRTGKPPAPGSLPKMMIEIRGPHTRDESDAKPDHLALNEPGRIGSAGH